jgi:hypothetical protein
MRPGEIRFVAREIAFGPRSSTWRIYDRERASWPVLLPALGLKVPQRFDTEGQAQAWASSHLNGGVATLPTPPARPGIRKRAS